MGRRGVGVLLVVGLTTPAMGGCGLLDGVPPCFSQTQPSLPTPETVRDHLDHAAAGQQVYDAVVDGDEERVAELVRGDEQLLGTRVVLPDGVRPGDGNDGDLLTFAVAGCDGEMVSTLLDLGADPDGKAPGLALTYALLADDLDLAEQLLGAGADPDAHGPDTAPPMQEVLLFERPASVGLLLDHGADPDRAEPVSGATPLGSALTFGDLESAGLLLEAGANPWQVGVQGTLPAWQLTQELEDDGADQTRRELLAEARDPDLPWPPPGPPETTARFLSGEWPTPRMEAAGFVASEGALRSMRRSAGE
ncbi:ankyrin repeat domain-containing protein [Serinicoccus marinus]|uniref:ankyrin repeat domain-containing protein n=1 Tax=Serinicoccus marinus TaxID=247333 RepID=UPI0024912FA4|nr:hypothetical protein [Serinicoccus marinus]